jgi:hypothetical protein
MGHAPEAEALSWASPVKEFTRSKRAADEAVIEVLGRCQAVAQAEGFSRALRRPAQAVYMTH